MLSSFRNVDLAASDASPVGQTVLAMHSLLFIEDDDQIRLALRLALEDEGYEVREAGDGAAGLAAFRE